MPLNGKTALVTGAARGIGRAIAQALAADGAAVGVADIRPDVEQSAEHLRALGSRAAAAVFNVALPDEVRRGVDTLRQELGEIDILVNNAGIVNNIAPLAKMTPDAWGRELGVNLGGPFNMIQAVIGTMVQRQWGRIINISSGAARGGLHNQAGYAASKAGVLGLTHTVTLEFARYGITCNAVLPGVIGTELVRKMPPEIVDNVVASTPARRLGEVEEVGRLVAFLASDEAAFINGAEIDIDGGLRLNTTSLASRKEIAGMGTK